jgi:hypothetical protein
VLTKLRERVRIGRVVVVADRAMTAQKAVKALSEHRSAPFDYVLGCRMRRQREVTEEVLARAGRYQEVAPNLKVKEVIVGDRRYVVCLNPEEAAKDEKDRQAILTKLEETLTALAKTYKGLWRVERTFREEKPTLEVRPICHQRDDTSISHIVASFLALRPEVDLQGRLHDKRVETSWPDLMRDLKQLPAVRMTLDGTPYLILIRTDFQGVVYQALKVARVRPSGRVMRLDGAPHPGVP